MPVSGAGDSSQNVFKPTNQEQDLKSGPVKLDKFRPVVVDKEKGKIRKATAEEVLKGVQNLDENINPKKLESIKEFLKSKVNRKDTKAEKIVTEKLHLSDGKVKTIAKGIIKGVLQIKGMFESEAKQQQVLVYRQALAFLNAREMIKEKEATLPQGDTNPVPKPYGSGIKPGELDEITDDTDYGEPDNPAIREGYQKFQKEVESTSYGQGVESGESDEITDDTDYGKPDNPQIRENYQEFRKNIENESKKITELSKSVDAAFNDKTSTREQRTETTVSIERLYNDAAVKYEKDAKKKNQSPEDKVVLQQQHKQLQLIKTKIQCLNDKNTWLTTIETSQKNNIEGRYDSKISQYYTKLDAINAAYKFLG